MEEELKEDIKILRKLLNEKFDEEMIHALDKLGKDVNETYVLTLPEREAIENILNRLEQDEQIINEMAEYIEYVSSDGDKDVMYAELYNCNQLDRDWTRGKEAEIKDILEYFRKKCE